jgi:hypothetical protein
MQGTGGALVDLAEQAGRHATTPADLTSEAGCVSCGRPLACGEVPGTTVTINTCSAHGTWFDRDGLRRVALHFAHLQPPLQFHEEDYHGRAPPPESLGDLLWQQAFPLKKRANDAIPYVAGVRAGGVFWSDEVLDILLAVAVLGTMVSASMHVASLFGHTVVNGPLHLIVLLAIFPPFGLGIWANQQMGNAVREGDGIAMHDRHLRRELRLAEWIVLIVVELYASLTAYFLWPAGTSEIMVLGSDLTVPNARAVWIFDLLFYVAAVAIVVVARRLARRTT